MNPQQISKDVLIEKYAKDHETTEDEIFLRVSKYLASNEKTDCDIWQERFFQAMNSGFIPGGRIMSSGGTKIEATQANCFVQPIADSISEDVDGLLGIYKALTQSAETMRRGGGVSYNFSLIRPKGAKVKKTRSNASGPVSYQRVFDSSCQTVESAGSRRGAQLACLNSNHPDIFDFLSAKDNGKLTNFNNSVGVLDFQIPVILIKMSFFQNLVFFVILIECLTLIRPIYFIYLNIYCLLQNTMKDKNYQEGLATMLYYFLYCIGILFFKK